MNIALRYIGGIGIIVGIILASYVYFGPGLQQQIIMSQYVASSNKDAFDMSHRNWRSLPGQDEMLERLVSIIYGFGIAVTGVGLVLISYKIEAVTKHGAA